MKVICVKQDNTTVDGPKSPPILIVGNYYTVILSNKFPDGVYYLLLEHSNVAWFHSELFAELDTNLDENTLVNEIHKSLTSRPLQ